MLSIKNLTAGMVLALATTAASAETVTIRFADGTFAIDGVLVSESDAVYVIKTTFGNMEISKGAAICDGCDVDVVASLN